jgi:hypothetical protein
MSLGVACAGPEGIVLAADSRVTLTAEMQQPGGAKLLLPATFDSATKLIRVQGQKYVAAVTYGAGAIGVQQPRTPTSFVPEFEAELAKTSPGRLSVEDFAKSLGAFFSKQWASQMPPNYVGNPMVFLVGGYDENLPYGTVFELNVPHAPVPIQRFPPGQFGFTWGGQREYTDRILQGFDDRLPKMVQDFLKLSDAQASALRDHLKLQLSARIPYAFLPLQDCVDLAIFLVRSTITIHSWIVDIRGVGGAIDVATITRTDGYVPVQQKKVVGER